MTVSAPVDTKLPIWESLCTVWIAVRDGRDGDFVYDF